MGDHRRDGDVSSALPVLLAAAAQQAANATPPGLALLQSATLWLDASDVTSGSQWMRNKGTGGRALDARFGSVGQAQIIKGALKLNGVVGNYASAPDSAALDITGDIEVVARIRFSDYTHPTTPQYIVSKMDSSSTMSYWFGIDTSGVFFFSTSKDGSLVQPNNSTALPFVDGTTYWVKVEYDVVSGADRVARYYYAADQATEPSSWTLHQTVTTAGGATSIFSSASTLRIGAGTSGTAGNATGDIYRVIVRNGIGGTIVFDADFTAQSDLATSFVESSSNAATVTINSTSGVDTNDPLLLPHTGTNYLYLPGASGNNASAPDSVALSITGDIDIQARIAPTDWTSSTQGLVAGKWGSTTGNQAYGLFLDTSGTLRFVQYSGAAYNDLPSTVATGFTDGEAKWVRATYSASGGTVKFYTAPDASAVPSSWTQLGTTVAGVARTTQNTANTLTLGESTTSGSNLLVGAVYRVRILDGYDGAGSVVFDANFSANTNQSSFTESSSNAATVTINRASTGRKAVMVVCPTLLFGTDDYLEVADNSALDFAASDSFSALVVARVWATPASFHVKLSKSAGGTGAGWSLWNEGTTAVQNVSIADGTTQAYDPGATYTLGQRYVLALVRDVSGDTIASWLNATNAAATTDTTTATLANAVPLFVGKSSGGAPLYSDMELDTVAVFPAGTVLNATTIGQIMSYLGVS